MDKKEQECEDQNVEDETIPIEPETDPPDGNDIDNDFFNLNENDDNASSDSESSDDSDSTDSDLQIRQISRISRRTKNQLDLVLGSDIDDSDDSTSSDEDGSGSDNSGQNSNNSTEQEKELVRKMFPMIDPNDPMIENPIIRPHKYQFGYRVPKLVRKHAIGHKRKREPDMKSIIYNDAVYQFHSDGMRELQGHTGCVNSLGWSNNGTRLVSGSDDLHFCIWDPCRQSDKPLARFRTGHRSNIFQTKFLPYSNDQKIISTARDGEIRMAECDNTGVPVRHSAQSPTRLLGKHEDSAHKLAFIPQTQVILSCGEDGLVYRIDPRIQEKSQQVLLRKRNDNTDGKNSISTSISLYTIDVSTTRPHFAIAGQSSKAFIYDLSVKPDEDTPVATFSPDLFSANEDTWRRPPNITCLKYDYCGSRLLCSYNDDDIYLFDVQNEAVLQTYSGHRNMQTIKGVNFYGTRSERVMSGSDCGHFYIWNTDDGSLLNSQFADGDTHFESIGLPRQMQEAGVVNVMEPCLRYPIMATSGLDRTVKIWSPTAHNFLSETDAIKSARRRVGTNRRNRNRTLDQDIDIQHWSSIIQILRRAQNRDSRTRRVRDGVELEEAADDDSSGDSEEGPDCRTM